MFVHPFMAEAIFLREHPDYKIIKDTGHVIWFDSEQGKYLWQNQKSEKRNRVYEAKGLQNWYNNYLKMLDAMEAQGLE